MIKEEQLIFFTGIPGSAWSRVATLCGYSPLLNLNSSDRSRKREYYIRRNTSWAGLVNHQGAFFGSKMEFGQGWEYPVERSLTKDAVMADIEKAFVAHTDENYLIKSHSLAQSLDWWIENFPKAKFIFTYRDFERSIEWWLNGGGFDITYPKYDWYEDEDRMRKKAKAQLNNTKEFINDNSIVTYGLTKGFLEEVLQIDFNSDPGISDHYRAINAMPRDKSSGVPMYDIQLGFYGFKDIL
jgi:hypothetical protein